MTAARTPSQTVGPFFGFGLPWAAGANAVALGTTGAIRITGRVLDGAGAAVPDALIETWQALNEAQAASPAQPTAASSSTAISRAGLRGFGRCPTDADGCYSIHTLKPAPIQASDGSLHAPQIAVAVFARGLLKGLVTRMYFEDEAAANAQDPVFRVIADTEARSTLLAARTTDGYLFDIRLQGERETLFFDV